MFIKGEINPESLFTVTELQDYDDLHSSIRLLEFSISYGVVEGWLVNGWFDKATEEEIEMARKKKEEVPPITYSERETIKLEDMPIGRLAMVTKTKGFSIPIKDYLYVVRFSREFFLKIWPGQFSSTGEKCDSPKAELDGFHLDDARAREIHGKWEVILLPETTSMKLVFNGEKGWQK